MRFSHFAAKAADRAFSYLGCIIKMLKPTQMHIDRAICCLPKTVVEQQINKPVPTDILEQLAAKQNFNCLF